ncbi:hypothetical protein [Bacillus sp. SM2101]|uniref:hypothetical protein n=1 Tax=Bacillus sp. SM2101 TaxID=2805366 RepID=UPI001BDEF4C5|nr:hypothetical protein [Bacillus sp. SM2101]
MKTVAIIGGSQSNTNKLAKKKGLNLMVHDGHIKGGGNKGAFKKIARKSVVLSGACCHPSN